MAKRTGVPPGKEETGETLLSSLRRLFTGRQGVSAIIAVAGAVALVMGLLLLAFVQEMRGAGYSVAALGAVMLLLALMVSFNAVRRAITGRQGRYSTNTAIMIVAFVALGFLVNLLAYRNPARWDTTATRQFTLAPQTRDLLTNLSEPVRATAFFVRGDQNQETYRTPAEDLLKEFAHQNPPQFSYRFVDPDQEVSVAKAYRINQYPTIVFEGVHSGLQHQLTAPRFEERDFTSALLIATGKKQKALYYLTGHGERDLGDTASASRQGAGLLADSLARDNYDVVPLSLAQDPTIPQDAAALILNGPTKNLEGEELALLAKYLKQGGRMLALLEPDPPESFVKLISSWGITPQPGRVVDLASSLAGQPQTPLVPRSGYLSIPPVDIITKPLDQTLFPGVAGLKSTLPPEEMPNWVTLSPLVGTTLLSCLTTDPEVNTCPRGDYGIRALAMAMEGVSPVLEKPDPSAPREARTTRMVVFGDADFASNYHLFFSSNRDLVLNSVNWLTEDISLANVRPKPIAFRNLVVTYRQMQFIRALSWFVLPAGVVLLAAVAWWRRR